MCSFDPGDDAACDIIRPFPPRPLPVTSRFAASAEIPPDPSRGRWGACSSRTRTGLTTTCGSNSALMRELGFTALKQCQVCRGTSKRKVMHMALDEGIIPWWFGEAALGRPHARAAGGARDRSGDRHPGAARTPGLARAAGQRGSATFVDASTTPDGDRLLCHRAARRGKRGAAQLQAGKDWVPSVQPRFIYEIDDEEAPCCSTG